MSNPVEILRGNKLDGNLRPMYFVLKNGKKTRIGEGEAMRLFSQGAKEVKALTPPATETLRNAVTAAIEEALGHKLSAGSIVQVIQELLEAPWLADAKVVETLRLASIGQERANRRRDALIADAERLSELV